LYSCLLRRLAMLPVRRLKYRAVFPALFEL
jgi:hypothetical protein